MTEHDHQASQRADDPNVPATPDGTPPYADPLPVASDDEVLESAREASRPGRRDGGIETEPRESPGGRGDPDQRAPVPPPTRAP